MTDLMDDLDRVEAAYRRAWASTDDSRTEDALLTELRAEGLGEEWTARNRPSTEILLASWRLGDAPDHAMELMRFALKARRP